MDIKYIEKRDGRVEQFKKGKITKAIFKAAFKVSDSDIEVDDRLVAEIIDKLHDNSIDISDDYGMRQLLSEIESITEQYDIVDTAVESILELIDMLVVADQLADEVVASVEESKNYNPTVENIQDTVENILIENGHAKTAKEYILYRAERNKIRDMQNSLMKTFEDLTFSDAVDTEVKRENANIDGDSAMGTMLRYGSESAKEFNLLYLVSEEAAKEHAEGSMHIHDLDFLSLTFTCVQTDLEKLFNGGFNTGHGYLREPGGIRSYAALACIAIQSSQNDMHGGQSIPAFDHYMAPGVAKTFVKQIVNVVSDKYDSDDYENIDEILVTLETGLKKYRKEHRLIMNEGGYEFTSKLLYDLLGLSKEKAYKKIIKKAIKHADQHTYQAMEAVVSNLNSMHSRAGAQVPFSSLNFATDTSEEGRIVTKNLLLATEDGLGNGETPIFPISIFKLKDGVNLRPGNPNYDLFKLACRVSAKRLFPNFSNLDAPFNLQFYKEGDVNTEISYMGCRTRTISNIYDKNNEIVTGRGNLSFTTINLPRLGILSGKGNVAKFKELLKSKLEIVAKQLLDRYKVQCRKHPKNFPFLMGQGIWLGSDKLGPNDDISEIAKHGSLSIGFIGLAEALVALTGKHHGESEESQKLGIEIITMMRDFCDRKSEEYKMNFGVIATPAEGLSGRFTNIDKKKFGIIPGVTDKDYYTNSMHVPVYYQISAFKKIRIEAPYHALCNAGHIAYIEMDGDPSKNLDAFEKIVLYMHDNGIGYGAINHPVDRDPVCGYTGIIDNECPRCGRKEGEAMTVDMWNKIKGYTHSASTCGTCGDINEELDRVPNLID